MTRAIAYFFTALFTALFTRFVERCLELPPSDEAERFTWMWAGTPF